MSLWDRLLGKHKEKKEDEKEKEKLLDEYMNEDRDTLYASRNRKPRNRT